MKKRFQYSFRRVLCVVAVPLFISALHSNRAVGDEPFPTSVASNRGLISLIADVYVPSNRSGRIASLAVNEGTRVEKDAIVARIDVRQEELEAKVALSDHEAAELKASSDVELRYATAAFKAAHAEMTSAHDANRRVDDAVSRIEMERLKLTVDQARLKIEAAERDSVERRTESDSSRARLDLARLNIERSQVRSPIAGEVAEVCMSAGEWIEIGRPLVRVIDLSRLRVETFVNVKDRSPTELHRHPAKIQVTLARGTTEMFTGEITFVNPIVQPGGFYRIWADVVNRRELNQWILRPGMEAEVTIEQ